MPERTIVITGASDGIGASAARNLARQGERVVVVGRSAREDRGDREGNRRGLLRQPTSPSWPRCASSPRS